MKPTRWSYSSLSTYEECPAKWKYSYVDGLESPPSPAMERGTKLHQLCETVLKEPVETPAELAKIAHILDRLKANSALSEKAWRVDAQWQSVESKSWLIGIIDVHFMRDGALHIYDFKSGRSYPSHKSQLELYALLGLSVFPEVERAECGAIYIDTGKLSHKRTIDRAEADAAKIKWAARADVMFDDQELPAKPGRGCFWCAFKDSLGGPCVAWRA